MGPSKLLELHASYDVLVTMAETVSVVTVVEEVVTSTMVVVYTVVENESVVKTLARNQRGGFNEEKEVMKLRLEARCHVSR